MEYTVYMTLTKGDEMKYTVERVDNNGSIIIGYKEEINAGGPYQAFLEWIDFHLERTTPADVEVKYERKTKGESEDRFHARVTELEGEKRTFTY
jgi:glucose-6-phosphate dehydrogenase assembly protein OpcA